MRIVILRKMKNHLQFVFHKRDYELLISALDTHIQSLSDLLAEDFVDKKDRFHFDVERTESKILQDILKQLVKKTPH